MKELISMQEQSHLIFIFLNYLDFSILFGLDLHGILGRNLGTYFWTFLGKTNIFCMFLVSRKQRFEISLEG